MIVKKDNESFTIGEDGDPENPEQDLEIKKFYGPNSFDE